MDGRPPIAIGGAMKSLMLLWQKVADELATMCCTSTTLDLRTIKRRVEHEGISFLTITLPSFCEGLQKGLSRGYVSHDLFTGFRWRGGLPELFQGFLGQVFDRETGRLVDEPSIEAIFAVRQLTLMFQKISIECSDARRERAIWRFIDCEQQIRRLDKKIAGSDIRDFTIMSRLLLADVFSVVDKSISENTVLPKHGPGATADRLTGNGKYNQSEWTQRLEGIFPMGEYLLPNWRYYQYLDRVDLLEPGSERPVRVITVPKTLKTPRIIAIEPTCMQYMQQGIMDMLVRGIKYSQYALREPKGDRIVHKYVLGSMIGFDDQVPNQQMASEGSRRGHLATLDLSDASDSVSNQLVRAMIADYPNLADGVDATRSRKADVPGHGVIRLAKFASMGSALCFPFEAMVFLTIVFLGIQRQLNRQLTLRDITSFRNQVRVYGDDIIVPVDYVQSVASTLETFGFRVNSDKSFWTGKFRESCGKEYYDSHDVSVVRVRQLFPVRRDCVPEIVSLVDLRNRFYMAGLWKTAAYLDQVIPETIRYYPTIGPRSPMLGRITLLPVEGERDCPHLHRPLVKGSVIVAKPPKSNLEGIGALLKVFHQGERRSRPREIGDENFAFAREYVSPLELPGVLDIAYLSRNAASEPVDEPVNGVKHLERSGRARSVTLTTGWGPATLSPGEAG